MKDKKVLIILSVIAIIVICAIVLGVLYFTTDLFKTDQQLFYKYLSQTEMINYNFVEQYNIANDRVIKNSNSSSADIYVSTSMSNQETGIADVQRILTMTSNALENVSTKQSYRDFTISNDNQNLLTLKYIRDDNTYAIGADNILAKYIAVENSNLKELFSKFGVEDTTQIPNSIPTNFEEILKIDEVTLENLSKTYFTLIYNNIDETHFYKTVNSDNTETIGVYLSEQEVYNITRLILETAKNDSVLLNLIVNKAQLLDYNSVTIENIQSVIQKYIDEITNNTYSTDKDFVNLSLIKNEKKVIGLNIENNYIEQTEEYESPIDDGFEIIERKINNKIEMNFSETNKIVIIAKENDVELLKGIMNYSYDANNIGFYIELETKEDEETNTIKIQYQTNNFQADNITQNCIIDVNSNNEENYQIGITNNITLNKDVIISKLTTENSAKLNDMTSEEISQLITALVARVMNLYGGQLNSL